MIHSQGTAAAIQLAHAARQASAWRAWGDHPESNVPTEHGGSPENRARMLLEVVDAVRAERGEHGVNMISVPSGGNVPAETPVVPGYQLPFATSIKESTGLPVAAVGMIDGPFQAEQIVAQGQSDVVLVGRESLRDPDFPIRAGEALRWDMPYKPAPYERAYR
ncbi:oxidoreductase [Nesterenkonia suensis]